VTAAGGRWTPQADSNVNNTNCILFNDGCGRHYNCPGHTTHGTCAATAGWADPVNYSFEIPVDAGAERRRHNDGINCAFYDGHAKWMKSTGISHYSPRIINDPTWKTGQAVARRRSRPERCCCLREGDAARPRHPDPQHRTEGDESMKSTTSLTALIALVVLGALLTAGCPKETTEPTTAPPSTTTTEAIPTPPPTETAAEPPENIGNAKDADGKYVCPVLGQPVTDFSPENSVDHEGKAYFFCCPGCKDEWDKDPAKHAAAAAAGEIPEGTGPADEPKAEESADPHAGHDHG